MEAVDLIILLSAWVASVGKVGAQPYVDAKMLMNRARRWDIQPDGTGRHK